MADDDTQAAEAAQEAAPARRPGIGGLLVNGAGIFVLALAAVVAGGFINEMLHPAPHEYVLGEDNHITVYVPPPPPPEKKQAKKKAQKPDAPAQFYSFDPPLVVNFEESSAVRFLQIGMDIMARDSETIEAVERHMPLIRNNLLLLISNRDYQKLMTREGKDELRKEALAEVKKIMRKEADEADVEDLLFTSFVVQ